MKECLNQILHEFEKRGKEQIDDIFLDFMECFSSLGAEKLEYPKEFILDVKLFGEGFAPTLKKFEDREIQYLMLSDFYDYCRLTKKYRKTHP